jgi:hypothetical protein
LPREVLEVYQATAMINLRVTLTLVQDSQMEVSRFQIRMEPKEMVSSEQAFKMVKMVQ